MRLLNHVESLGFGLPKTVSKLCIGPTCLNEEWTCLTAYKDGFRGWRAGTLIPLARIDSLTTQTQYCFYMVCAEICLLLENCGQKTHSLHLHVGVGWSFWCFAHCMVVTSLMHKRNASFSWKLLNVHSRDMHAACVLE